MIALRAPDDALGGTLLHPGAGTRSLVVCIHGGGCHSGYFNAGKDSLASVLTTANHAVLLVERPGSLGRPLLDEDLPLEASWRAIRDFAGQVWKSHGDGLPIALVGHSIGGALALTIAADAPDWPLAAVIVSGIGDEPPPLVIAWPAERGDAISTDAADFFLGPAETWEWRGLTRLRKVTSPWNVAERLEVVREWPSRWPVLASRVRVPVHLRLADGERIWITGEKVVSRMAAALVHSPMVDAALLPEGGHLYEFHKRGPELARAQAAFLNRVLA